MIRLRHDLSCIVLSGRKEGGYLLTIVCSSVVAGYALAIPRFPMLRLLRNVRIKYGGRLANRQQTRTTSLISLLHRPTWTL